MNKHPTVNNMTEARLIRKLSPPKKRYKKKRKEKRKLDKRLSIRRKPREHSTQAKAYKRKWGQKVIKNAEERLFKVFLEQLLYRLK